MLIETAIQELLATIGEPTENIGAGFSSASHSNTSHGSTGHSRASNGRPGDRPGSAPARRDLEACLDDFLAYCRSVAPHARTVEELPPNCQGCWRILCAYYRGLPVGVRSDARSRAYAHYPRS